MEAGAAFRLVEDLDGATMLLNDTVCDRQAEARPFARALCGEKRIVNTMDVLRITSGTTSSVLTNLIVSAAGTLVVNGTSYTGPLVPACAGVAVSATGTAPSSAAPRTPTTRR